MLTKQVLLAMIGGVDSSVAAYLLQQERFEVTGLPFIFWKSEQTANTEAFSSIDNTKKIAQQLDIRHYVKDVSIDFKNNSWIIFTMNT